MTTDALFQWVVLKQNILDGAVKAGDSLRDGGAEHAVNVDAFTCYSQTARTGLYVGSVVT